MKIEMHLFDDYKAASIKYLRSLIANGLRVKGFPQGEIPDDEWFNAKGLDYVFEYFHRRIPAHPREVRVCSHFCCPEDLKDEYLKIVDEITTGVDLSNRQTWRIDRIGSHDPLFNEWGLHHLHFSKRNGDRWEVDEDRILFIYVTDKTVYVIAIGRHEDFESMDLLVELNKDYPSLFPHLKDATKTNWRTREEIKQCRNVNVNVVDVLDGGAISCLGSGTMMTGSSTSVYMRLVAIRSRLDVAEKVIEAKFQEVAKRYFPNRPDIYDGTKIRLKLTDIDDDKLILDCEELRLKVGLRDKGQEKRFVMAVF